MTHRPGPGRPPHRPPRRNGHTWRVTSPPPPKRPGGLLSFLGCNTVLAAPAAALIAALLYMKGITRP